MRTQHIVLALAMLALSAAPAAAERVTIRYEGHAFGFLQFGAAEIEVVRNDEQMSARATLASGGLAALFAKARLKAEARATLSGASLSPQTFDLDHTYGETHRVTALRWTAGGVERRVTPERAQGDPPASEAQKREARDPLATFLAMGFAVGASQACAGTFRIYDGRFVYDVRLAPKRRDRFKHSGLDLPVIVCAMTQQRIAGYKSREDLAKKMPTAEIWFALDGRAFSAPLEVRAPLPLGTAIVRAQALIVSD